MKIVYAFLILAAGGCLIVPSKSLSSRELGTVTSAQVRYGVSRGLALKTSVERSDVTVHVTRKRDCSRDVFAVTEVSEETHLGLGGVEDPRGRFLGALIAPITIPISFAVSAVIVACNCGSKRETRRLERVITTECAEPGDNVPVDVQLASGAHLALKTGTTGTVTFQIPDGEPQRGTVIARAETQSVELKYRRRVHAETTAREAVLTCAQQHGVTGALDVRIDVNANGLPTRVSLDRGDVAFTTCITTQIARLQFPEIQRGRVVVLPVQL